MRTRRFGSFVALSVLTSAVSLPSPVGASPDAPTADEVCALLSIADATALFGKPVEVRPGNTQLGSSGCVWSDGSSGGIQVMVETDALLKASPTTAGQTAARRFEGLVGLIQKKQAEDVAGVGDKAVWSTKAHLLWVLKGKKVVTVSVLKQFSPMDDLPRVKKIAAKVVTKI